MDETGEPVLFTLDDLASSVYPDMPVELLNLDSFTNFTKGTRKSQKLPNNKKQIPSNTPSGFFIFSIPISCLFLPCIKYSYSSPLFVHSDTVPAPSDITPAPARPAPPAQLSQAEASSPSPVLISVQNAKESPAVDTQTTSKPSAPLVTQPHTESTQECDFS